jgi:transposase-like protein
MSRENCGKRNVMNLVNVIQEFQNDDDCRAYLEKIRWPEGVRCVRCQGKKTNRMKVTQVRRGKTYVREIFECASCLYQFSVTAGTVFHDSHLPLRTWLMVVAMMCAAKKGISANQVKRHFQINYRTAWYLCHRIRSNSTFTPRDLSPDQKSTSFTPATYANASR